MFELLLLATLVIVVGVVCWAKGFADGEKYQATGGFYARKGDNDE